MKITGASFSGDRDASARSSAVNFASWRSIATRPSLVLMKLSGLASTITIPSAGRYQPKYDEGIERKDSPTRKSWIDSLVEIAAFSYQR